MAVVPFAGVQRDSAPGTILGVPDDYQRVQASPADFGAAQGQAAQQLGGDFQQAANAATDIQGHFDQTATLDAMTQLKAKATTLAYGDPTDPNAGPGFMMQHGATAMSAYAPTVAALQKQATDLAANLSPNAQRAFAAQSAGFLSDTQAKFDAYRATAQQSWNLDTLDASAATSQSAAIANSGDDTAFKHNLADSQRSILSKASQLGWSPEVITQQIQDYTSKTYVGATERLETANPSAAYDYLNANRQNMTGQDQLALESRLRPAMNQLSMRSKADAIWQKYTSPMTALPSGPVPDKVVASARAQGVDPSVALTIGNIETGLGTVPDRPGSQYQGTFQMGDAA